MNERRNDNNWKILDVAKLIQSRVKECELKFLRQTEEEDTDDLVKDRKIQDGVDKRTYRVSFDRIHKTLPGFEAHFDVETGVERLLEELERWRLNETKFKQREFYRLQQIEHLYETEQINDDLFFK